MKGIPASQCMGIVSTRVRSILECLLPFSTSTHFPPFCSPAGETTRIVRDFDQDSSSSQCGTEREQKGRRPDNYGEDGRTQGRQRLFCAQSFSLLFCRSKNWTAYTHPYPHFLTFFFTKKSRRRINQEPPPINSNIN